MKKGDWVVCVHHRFANFTKGKKYQLIEDVYRPESIEVTNDLGNKGFTSLYGYEVGKKVYYFRSIEDVREKKLNQLGI